MHQNAPKLIYIFKNFLGGNTPEPPPGPTPPNDLRRCAPPAVRGTQEGRKIVGGDRIGGEENSWGDSPPTAHDPLLHAP